ncbi:MAG: YbaK/EbsC family protein [Gammaproteobacteria bacterium]|nr:YbaK/EbsC family protein [Gammaproteobacteria bacterium]
MKPANIRVKTCLQRAGLEVEIKILPAAVRTAQLAAEALGCQVGQIANSLVFTNRRDNSAVLIMSPGGHRVDLQKVKQSTGLELGKADADFVRQQTGFAIGGVPPVAHSKPLRTILEASLHSHEMIWSAAGTPESVFSMSPLQLQQITGGTWLDIVEA